MLKNKFNLITQIAAIIILAAILVACNSGGSTNLLATSQDLPNVFDQNSVQNILVETITLSGDPLDSIDLTKVGGHASYKIRLTNPNKFAMNLTAMKIVNNQSISNYYFSKNGESDNCFNQSWYTTASSQATLSMPANGKCSFYTVSLWTGIDKHGSTDTFDYTVANQGFGFKIESAQEGSIWCKSGCSPTGVANVAINSLHNNSSIRLNLLRLTSTNDELINSVESTGFALGGDYIFTRGIRYPGYLSFIRYKFNSSGAEFSTGWSVYETDTIVGIWPNVNEIPFYSGFATSNDGNYIAYNFWVPNYPLATIFQPVGTAGFSSPAGNVHTTGLQGLDNKIWWNSSTNNPYYLVSDIHSITMLSNLSPNLPASGHILGVDANSNLVIKTDGRINCYNKLAGYTPKLAISLDDSSITDKLADNLISSKHLYTNHVNRKASLFTGLNKYYDLNMRSIEPGSEYQIYYPLNTGFCDVIPDAATGEVNFLVVPKDYTLIITDKYTAIKTRKGYAFASSADTSDGSNNLD